MALIPWGLSKSGLAYYRIRHTDGAAKRNFDNYLAAILRADPPGSHIRHGHGLHGGRLRRGALPVQSVAGCHGAISCRILGVPGHLGGSPGADTLGEEALEQCILQRDLADLSGVTNHFLSNLENGKASSELQKVLRVLQSLGISLVLEPRGGDKGRSA